MSGLKSPTKTWFPMNRGAYERTLVDQLKGLRPVIDEVRTARARGRPLSVLDVGCAEGLIGIELAKQGAARVHGVEIVPERVRDANRLRGSLPCSFEEGDVGTYEPRQAFDVVMALSILHKLPDPSAALYRLTAMVADRLVVIRLPPGNGPMVIDPRSGNKPHDLDKVLRGLHFNLEHEAEGHLDEWIGIWRFKE